MLNAMRLLSPRELADALGVSESSLKRWVDKGKLVAARTDGGHRRIALPEAVRFIRETGAPLARPDLLDLPEVAVAREREALGEAFLQHLMAGDAVAARGWLMGRYLAGASVAELCDGPVRAAMSQIGELWHHEADGIYVEHRATDACLQALAHLRNLFDAPADAPLALGGAPDGDPYLLPSFMAAMTVSAAGLRAINLGPTTPLDALDRATARHAPKLIWLSLSTELTPGRAKDLARWLTKVSANARVAVGGRYAHQLNPIRGRVRRIETMAELAMIAGEVVAAGGTP